MKLECRRFEQIIVILRVSNNSAAIMLKVHLLTLNLHRKNIEFLVIMNM